MLCFCSYRTDGRTALAGICLHLPGVARGGPGKKTLGSSDAKRHFVSPCPLPCTLGYRTKRTAIMEQSQVSFHVINFAAPSPISPLFPGCLNNCAQKQPRLSAAAVQMQSSTGNLGGAAGLVSPVSTASGRGSLKEGVSSGTQRQLVPPMAGGLGASAGYREKLSSAGGSTFADARERERVIASLQNNSEVCVGNLCRRVDALSLSLSLCRWTRKQMDRKSSFLFFVLVLCAIKV